MVKYEEEEVAKEVEPATTSDTLQVCSFTFLSAIEKIPLSNLSFGYSVTTPHYPSLTPSLTPS
jgi:hypothetical protein